MPDMYRLNLAFDELKSLMKALDYYQSFMKTFGEEFSLLSEATHDELKKTEALVQKIQEVMYPIENKP